mmetsp:Transcript_33019/g.83846  ORF Transcript_33019/g.83846 Transcript_33019/m.83846 type:complete len:819 (-) Transcript_33019:8-2464(-)
MFPLCQHIELRTVCEDAEGPTEAGDGPRQVERRAPSRSNRVRDLSAFMLGGLLGLLIARPVVRNSPSVQRLLTLHDSTLAPQAEVPDDELSPWYIPGETLPAQQPLASGGSGKNYAFVQIVHDDPKGPPRQLWRSLVMAKALHKFSRYPLVLIAELGDQRLGGESAIGVLANLNVHVVPPSSLLKPSETGIDISNPDHVEYLRIYVWGLTQFDKVIWLDTHAVLFRSMDAVFEYAPPLEWREEMACPSVQTRAAMLLVQPRQEDVEQMAALFGARHGAEWAAQGMEGLIGHHFDGDLPLLNDVGASAKDPWALSGTCIFGGNSSCSCLPPVRNGSSRRSFPMPMPALVFRSSASSDCFSTDIAAQEALVDGVRTNVCQHPLGSYWRDLLCEAWAALPEPPPEVRGFCEDGAWFLSTSSRPPLDRGDAEDVRPRANLQICNTFAGNGGAQPQSPVWTVDPKVNLQCFNMVKALSLPFVGGEVESRNWCWVGLKEYGCHVHLWEHYSWTEMHLLSVANGGTVPLPAFNALQDSALCDHRSLGASPEIGPGDREEALAWFKGNVSVYVLNLRASTERRATFTKNFGDLGIPFEIVWGVDLRIRGAWNDALKQGLIPASFDLGLAQQLANLKDNGMGPVLGTIGCAAGHLRAQLVAATRKSAKPISLIFEDDVAPEEDFVVRVWKLIREEVPCDWQAVSLRSGCPYGICVSPRLTRVLPDTNEPAWRCRHGVNYGFQGMLYRTSELLRLRRALRPVVFNARRPHCLDVDVALAAISDRLRYYAVPAVQAPGFLKETNQGSTRWSINMDTKWSDQAQVAVANG